MEYVQYCKNCDTRSKKCKKCREIKSLDDFPTYNYGGSKKVRSKCKECFNSARRRTKGPLAIKSESVNFAINEIKRKMGCHCCKLKHEVTRIFEFHHIDPESKEYKISEIIKSTSANLEVLTNELNKCVLLCSVCHKILHEYESKNESKYNAIKSGLIPLSITLEEMIKLTEKYTLEE